MLPRTDSPRNDQHLVVEQVNRLFDLIPMLLFLNSIIALVISLFITQWLAAPIATLWLLGVILLNLLRFGHNRIAGGRGGLSRKISWQAGLLVLATLFSGLVWGSLGMILPVLDNVLAMVFTVIVLTGMTAGSLAPLSHLKTAYIAFAVPVMLPFAVRCLLAGDHVLMMVGILALIFLAVNIFYSFLAEKSVQNIITLSQENRNLIERLRLEKENAEATREIAVRNNEAKTRFLAAASHDLRQPLHAMGFFVEALMAEASTPKLVALARKIDHSLEALRDLLTSLLDISRIESGILKPRKTHFCLGDVMEDIRNDFAPTAGEKGIALEFQDCQNIIVHSDRAMLGRIMRNLVSNAIRYTHYGFVRLTCDARGAEIVIRVRDSGPGIPADKCREVFREFFQINTSARDRRKGLGLGLSIVDGLCRLLNHRITLESEEGRGSTFSVHVPKGDRSRIALSEEQGPLLEREKAARILVIDDEQSSREGMREMIAQWGHRVYIFDGPVAAELFMDLEGYQPDLIIADYGLKDGVTGDQAIHKLQTFLGRKVPGLIVTGDTDKERIREARASGFTLLHKPVQPAKLRSVMTYLINRTFD